MCPPGQAPEVGALISLLKRRAPAVSSGFETAVSFARIPRSAPICVSHPKTTNRCIRRRQMPHLSSEDGWRATHSDRSAIRREQSEPLNSGSRAAVLRRSEGHVLPSERRRSRRLPKRDPRSASAAIGGIQHGSRAVERRRSLQRRSFLCKRRRRRRAQNAIRRERSEPLNTVPPMGFEPMLERV